MLYPRSCGKEFRGYFKRYLGVTIDHSHSYGSEEQRGDRSKVAGINVKNFWDRALVLCKVIYYKNNQYVWVNKSYQKMGRKHEFIQLTDQDLNSITEILNKGVHRSAVVNRAHILFLNHEGLKSDEIVNVINRSKSTVYNILRTYKQSGLKSAIYDDKRSGRPKIISGKERAKITALACTDPPDGHVRWTLRLLADRVVELGYVDKGDISHTWISEILKKTN